VNEAKTVIKGDVKLNSLNVGEGVQATIAGAGVLKISQYVNFDAGGAMLELCDRVSLEVGNRTRLYSGLTTVTLNDSAKLSTMLSFL
jgi:hypothetical protein